MLVVLQVAIQNKCRFPSTMFEIPEGTQKIQAWPGGGETQGRLSQVLSRPSNTWPKTRGLVRKYVLKKNMYFYMEQNGISMDIHYQSLQWHWNVTHFDSGGYGCQRSKCLFSLRSSNDVIDTWAFADDSDVEHITYPIGSMYGIYIY